MNKLLTLVKVNFIAVIVLLLFSPVLRVEASESNSAVWHVDSNNNRVLYSRSPGSAGSTAISVNVQMNHTTCGNMTTYDLTSVIDTTKQLTVTYTSFSYSFDLLVQRYSTTGYQSRGGSLASGLKPCLYDNLGNTYLLDAENGGSFIIEDVSNITLLKFGYTGQISGTVTYNPSTYKVGAYYFKAENTAIDITLSVSAPARTIIDSEGTAWTVPDEVGNPVVIDCSPDASGSVKYLLDAVDGLSYFIDSYSTVPGEAHVLCSESQTTVTLYPLSSESENINVIFRQSAAADFGIEPVYCSTLGQFTRFLYGTLPEMEVTPLTPAPTEPPEPTYPPESIMPLDLGEVKVNAPDENGAMIDEGTVTVPAFDLVYQTKNANSNFGSADANGIRDVTVEDYCPRIIGFFDVTTAVDGYLSFTFPALHIDLDEHEIQWDTAEPVSTAMLQHEDLESIIYLYANGEKYQVSPYGGSVRIPINSGKTRITFELGLQVKADLTTNYPVSFRLLYKGNLKSFDVNIRTYKDQAASDVSQIKDLLENSDKAEDLGNANDSLGNIFGDYNDVETEGMGNAVGNIDSFDMDNTFKFGGGLLSALNFWLPIITSVISGMGDFAVLYTIGITLSFLMIVVGAVRFALSQASSESRKGTNSKNNVRSGKKSSGKGKSSKGGG